jgi:hypothetical protein
MGVAAQNYVEACQLSDMLGGILDALLKRYNADEIIDHLAGAFQRAAGEKIYELPKRRWAELADATADLREAAARADNAFTEQFPPTAP